MMSMVALSWIVHTGYLLWEPQQSTTNPNHTIATTQGQVQDTTKKTGTGEVIPDHSLIFPGIAAKVVMTHTEAAPGHDTGIIAATPGVAHNTHAPHIEITVTNATMTYHIDPTTDHPHTEVPQPTTPEIEVDPAHIPSANPPGEICTHHIHIPADHKATHTTRRT